MIEGTLIMIVKSIIIFVVFLHEISHGIAAVLTGLVCWVLCWGMGPSWTKVPPR